MMEDEATVKTQKLNRSSDSEIRKSTENDISLMNDDLSSASTEISHISHSSVEERHVVEFKSEMLADAEVGSYELAQFSADSQSGLDMGVVMKTEEVGPDGETVDGCISSEGLGQQNPQQFIILTRAAEGGTEPVDLPEGGPSKYIRFDAADGQTYVLAVPDELAVVMEEPTKMAASQPVAPAKSVKVGRKRPAPGPSTSTTALLNTASSSRAKPAPSGDGINQAWFTTRDDKNALHKEGHKWKQGQWTKEEIEILEANINSYCKEHAIKDPTEVIFEMSKDERKDFYRTIALGIQRPLFSVYRRVTRMYDRKNHRGKYTPNEMKCLRVLRAKHGTDWAAIGVALGRSASSVKDKCRLMKENCNSGKWYREEEERLAAAVYKLTGVKPSESITSGLSWASVAEHVGTRSEKQCRTKWLNYLNWKQQGGSDWTREDDTLLIDKVSKMNVNNDSEIDWVALSTDWASVRSPQWLRGKWWALKRHIADYNKLSYPDLLEQMKQVIFWNLKPKVGGRQSKSEPAAEKATSSSHFLKNCFPVSITAGVDGDCSLSLSYCPPAEEEGFQAFQVLQQWTPHVLGQISQNVADGGQGEGHIIVQTLTPNIGDSIQVNGQQQVIISTTGMAEEEDGGSAESMTIQLTEGLAQGEQDLNVLTSSDELNDTNISATFAPVEGEEIVTVSEFHGQPVTGGHDILTHNVFETVTSEADGDLVMGVSSPTHTNSLMTSLKDPILMSSSDVDCEKSQTAELTDEHSEGLMD